MTIFLLKMLQIQSSKEPTKNFGELRASKLFPVIYRELNRYDLLANFFSDAGRSGGNVGVDVGAQRV